MDAENKAAVRVRAERLKGASATGNDARLERILRVLSEYSMVVVSGTKLAQEISATRGEVWRLVQQLRAEGVAIHGHPATGYRLEAMPDLLLPDAVNPLVSGTIFSGKIQHTFKTASTNATAMQAGAAGEPEGTVFLAEEQTAGKGRGGHSWHSEPAAGVYCSVLLRPPMAPADAVPMSMMVGLAAAASVEEVTGLKPDLRWPNDLLLVRSDPAVPVTVANDPGANVGQSGIARKFCGILTELNGETTRVRYLVAGIGINVNHAIFPPEIADIATSLRIEGGREYSRVEITGALLRAIDREYRALKDDLDTARADIFRRFEQRSSYARGVRVRVEEDDGYEGTTEGLDDRGFLRVRTEKGVRTVLHGGVRALTDADADKF